MDVGSYKKAVTALTAGHLYVIGNGGDDDPKHALEQVVVTNTGSVGIRVGHSLTGILSGGRYMQVGAGGSLPLEGPLENLIVYNFDASTAASFSVAATCCARNSGQDAGLLSATDLPASNPTRYQVIRPTRTAGETKTTTVPVKYQRTLTSIKAYAVTAPTGATMTVDLLDSMGRTLLTSKLDQEALTNATIYTGASLTTTTSLLTIGRGLDLTLSCVSSSGGDTLNDLLIELAHVVA